MIRTCCTRCAQTCGCRDNFFREVLPGALPGSVAAFAFLRGLVAGPKHHGLPRGREGSRLCCQSFQAKLRGSRGFAQEWVRML